MSVQTLATGQSASSMRTSKTITFTGATGLGEVGAVPIFTVTGEVVIDEIVPFCTVNLGEASATSTISLGVTGNTVLFIAATVTLNIDANTFWMTTTPTANGIAVPAACKGIAITDNIIATAIDTAVNAGAIRFDVRWHPLSADGLVA